MRHPDNTLVYEGKEIAVRLVETIGDATGKWDSGIYVDSSNRFYIWEGWTGKSFDDAFAELQEARNGGEIFMPRDSEALNAICGETTTIVRRVSEQAALEFYVREFVNDRMDDRTGKSPIYHGLMDAIASHVPKAERKGRVHLVAWITRAVNRELRRTSKFNKRTPNAQLQLFVMDGIKREKAKRSERRGTKTAASEAATVQLQMATALVEVVRKLDGTNRPETLAEARRQVSMLHQCLHREPGNRKAANG